MKITFPEEIRLALDSGAALAISVSGGKDSQAMLEELVKIRHMVKGEFFAIHADLGRAEWQETEAYNKELCRRLGVPLVVVRRAKGDLFQRIESRALQLAGTGKPFWPSSKNRYCTSDLKRDPIDKYLRRFDNIICAIGIRRQESTARSRKCDFMPRKRIVTQTRQAYDWNPIIEFTESDVWESCGTSIGQVEEARAQYEATGTYTELGIHPAYVYGNQRLSCSFCVLGCLGDLKNGKKHNPEAYYFLVSLEQETGSTFKNNMALADI